MARITIPLAAIKIKSAKPRDKAYKLFDGQGLFLFVDKTGGKLWRLKYKSPVTNKEKTYSMGRYPDLSLLLAREKRQELRSMIAQGIDPMLEKQGEKIKQIEEEVKQSDTFKKVAEAFFNNKTELSEGHLKRQKARLKNDIYPFIGNIPITEVTRLDIINAVKKIEDRGTIETAHRVLSLCNEVFRYATAHEKIPHNILADIDKKSILKPSPDKHYPTITEPEEIKHLLNAIDGYKGEAITRYALQLLPYLASRSGNIRMAEWREIDFESSQWVIDGEKMKVKVKIEGTNNYQPHAVPLSLQAMEIIKELQMLTRESKYLFPSPLDNKRPMSDNTLNSGLKRLGYKGLMTPHSFRSMFSTVMNEKIDQHGFHTDIIERQLAHIERNKVKSAYNHAEYLPQRKELMQWWADYLDRVKRG